jgi:sugar lactone lactonase YvrE
MTEEMGEHNVCISVCGKLIYKKTIKFGHSYFAKDFLEISAITIDKEGNVYVVDSTAKCVKKFNQEGQLISKIEKDEGKFTEPTGITINSQNQLVIADSLYIKIFVPNGDTYKNILEKENYYGSFLRYIFSSSDGFYYATDSASKISCMTSNGEFKPPVGNFGDGNVQFKAPEGIFISQENEIYIADFGNNRIQVLDNKCNFKRKLVINTANEGLKNPKSIMVDKEKVYVTDSTNIIKVINNKTGNLITKYEVADKPKSVWVYKDELFVASQKSIIVLPINK